MSDTFQQIGTAPSVVNARAAAVFAKDEHGRVLCQLRDDFDHVAANGQWSLFGGQVEAGETPRDAAQREFLEETGLHVALEELTPLAKIASTVKPDWEICIFALGKVIDPADVRLGEGAGFAFLTAEQITKMNFIKTYQQFFDTFLDGNAESLRI